MKILKKSEHKLELIAIKTKDGKYYIAKRNESRFNSEFLFDGKKLKPTFDEHWFRVDSKPKKITRMVSQSNINHRYQIQDNSMISDKLKEFFEREEVAVSNDGFCCWNWIPSMEKYESLYREVSDEQPDKEEEWDFDLEILLEISKIVEPSKMNYRIQPDNRDWQCNRPPTVTADNIHYQPLDKMIFPDLILPQCKCKLSSKDTYKIVRAFVKDNIDPRLAEITSDYDFCFTVKRRIKLAEIENYTVDVNNTFLSGQRKRKPKYVTKQKIDHTETCFEMTNAVDKYKSYTVIEGFSAENQKELKEKIDNYCQNLIEFINTEMHDCKYCKGLGIKIPRKVRDKSNESDAS